MNDLNPEKWDYWLRLGSWDHKVAAVILAGQIPTEASDVYTRGNVEPLVDIYAAYYELDLVRTHFQNRTVAPKEFLEWCKTLKLNLHSDLLDSAEAIPFLNVKKADFQPKIVSGIDKPKKVSAHWGEIRESIFKAALQTLGGLNRDEAGEYFLPNGGLNSARLSEKIHDERAKFDVLREEPRGASLENIKNTLRDTIAGRPPKK